jgi:hypothetical protein
MGRLGSCCRGLAVEKWKVLLLPPLLLLLLWAPGTPDLRAGLFKSQASPQGALLLYMCSPTSGFSLSCRPAKALLLSVAG